MIGKAITVNRTRFTVIGVAAAGFQGTEPLQVDFWAPVTMEAAFNAVGGGIAAENWSWLVMMGRLKPGVSLSEVRADLGVIAGRIDQRYPGRKTTLAIDSGGILRRSGRAAWGVERGCRFAGGGWIGVADRLRERG